MAKIFISRSLDDNSLFHTLKNDGHQVFAESLIYFKPTNLKLEKTFDWLFFYSKNGINWFVEKHPDYHAKIAVMAQASAEFYFQLTGKKVDFIASDNASPAISLDKVISNQSICFVQANNSLKRFQDELSKAANLDEFIAYSNEIKTELVLPYCEHLIFTSPLNVEAYFRNHDIEKEQKVYAIGKTTEAKLVDYFSGDIIVASTPSEQSLFSRLMEQL